MIVEKFTPEVLISAPRRGPAVPNYDGTLALYTESTHIGGKSSKTFNLLDIATGVSSRILHDDQAYEPTWLGDGTNTIVYLRSGGMGVTFIITLDVDRSPPEPHVAGHFRAPVHGLKTKALRDGTLAFAVLGYVDTDGKLHNVNRRTPHDARVYDSFPLRIGDLQKEPHTYTIWYSTLSKQDGAWRVSGDLHNALKDANLRVPFETGRYENVNSQYDLCETGIAVAASSSEYHNQAWCNVSNIYLIRVYSFGTGALDAPKKISVQSEEYQGMCTLPQFSPDGYMVAFLLCHRPKRESSQVYVYHTSESQSAISVFDMVTGKSWPLAPTGFRFSADGHSFYITAEDSGQVGLYHLNLQPNAYPQALLRNGTVSAFHPLGRGDRSNVLVTSSSFVETCLYQVVSHDPAVEPVILSSASNNGSGFGLSPKQVSEVYFEGGGGNYVVHAWIVRPRDFDESKKYPLAVLVHDTTPNNTWLNAWDIKWNPMAWAEQGYVVVLPNITGSTGYGQDLATAIQDDWSGRPYDDLVSCIYSLRGVPGVDVDNAIIAGEGYGGYLINWIQGHPLARRFKAMVCYAGIFNTQSMMLQSNGLGFNEHIGEQPLSGPSLETLEHCNPAQPTLLQNWKTPMFVIHNEYDSVCPVSEGLAAYNHLRFSGVPSKFLTFKDEGHDVLKEENLLEWYRQVFAWINKYTKSPTEEGSNTTGAT
ncbi:prolyl oligopeptidase [Xylaria castorea]|nr:prolyl oligopeptidase [Xylaria castorea]